MKLRKTIIKHYELLFYGSYSVFLFFSVLMSSLYFKYFASLYKPMVVVCAVLLLCKEVLCRAINRRTIWGIAILYLLAAHIIYRGSGVIQVSFAASFLFAFGARNIDFRRICKCSLVIMSLLLIFVIASSMAGIIQNYRTETMIRTREYLGFRYALYAPTIFANIVFLYIYLRGDRLKLIEAAIMFAIFLYLYKKTDARLTFALSSLTLVLALLYKRYKRFFLQRKTIPALMTTAFIVACLLSVVLTYNYNPNSNWMNRVNAFLGNRLELGQTSLSRFGAGFFGSSNIEWIGNGLDPNGQKSIEEYLYVDNMYVQILQRYGVIFLVAYVALGTLTMIRCYLRRDYLMLLLLTMLAGHGIIDDLILYLQYNTFILMFGIAVFGMVRDFKSKGTIRIYHTGNAWKAEVSQELLEQYRLWRYIKKI